MNQASSEHYRQRLLELRARHMDTIESVVEQIPEKIGSSGNLSNLPTHNADRESEGLDAEIALETNQEELLRAVEAALERIEEGTYGLCEDCGCNIPRERLETLPFTKFCTPCATRREEEEEAREVPVFSAF